jgi:hypothetical protein
VEYRCYFMNAARRIHRVNAYEAASDQDASDRAREKLQKAQSGLVAAEVWHHARFVGKIDREQPAKSRYPAVPPRSLSMRLAARHVEHDRAVRVETDKRQILRVIPPGSPERMPPT